MFALIQADLRRFSEVLRGEDAPGFSRRVRDFLSPRFAPVLLYRIAFALQAAHLGPLAKMVSLVNFIFFGIEIAVRCPIGPGLFLPHTQGTVIGAVSIGRNATIYQGVTIGAREFDRGYLEEYRPIIGDDVLIGSGAKVLGAIKIGDRVRIGANAVAMVDVSADVLAVGAGLRIIDREP
jgi:serine O-acetyltransferase